MCSAARRPSVAADRFDEEFRRGDGLTGNEDEWGSTARYKAARRFALAGDRLVAQALLPQLEAEDRAEVEPLLTS